MNKQNAIGKEQIRLARETLSKYKAGKANLEARIISNEQWWKGRNWEQIGDRGSSSDPKPSSAWLFNSIANKHAEAMESFPEACVMPREESDLPEAELLTDILPVIFELNDYKRTYSDLWWSKLIYGTAVTGVFWSNGKTNGMGDVDVREIDLLNLYWEPGIKNIQSSRNLFNLSLEDNDVLAEKYPQLKGRLGTKDIAVTEYIYDDAVDTTDKSVVVDWYYKKPKNGRTLVHYCKFVGDELLYASENDPYLCDRGWYDHGQYPFVFDKLYTMQGTPCGFGYIDIMRDTQTYIDRLNSVILKNALASARVRYFVRGDGSVNEDEFSDTAKELVHVSSSSLGEDSIRQIVNHPLSPVYTQILNMKIDEMKETSSNRDFSQGSSVGGVTSGVAITALQEAGNKIMRDMIGATYRGFAEVCGLVIELIRQFYTEPRSFRITGRDGAVVFMKYDNSGIAGTGDLFGDPVFDLKIDTQRGAEYGRAAKNQTAQELYSMGFFDPENARKALCALELMDFDGKNRVVERITEGLHNDPRIV
ncbi:MAG: hypothetical protein IJT91_00620 [Clostridia bacterium]|nr:hypothetical protein [Clostridia bacterium]